MRIRISLPENRDHAGRLEVLDASGTVILGPFPAAGRAHDELAAAHGNASRNPLRPYGDTPLGTYAVRGVIESGFETALGRELGVDAVALLEPVSGETALADAHGRFRLFIEGGDDDDGRLRATAGAIRLHDRDQRELLALLRRTSGRVLCEVIATSEQGARVSLARLPLDLDPPALPGEPYVSTPPSRALHSSNLRPASYIPRMFVMVERSGSGGGTAYGGDDGSQAGESAGGTLEAGADPNDTGTGLPVTDTDVAPRPGADLSPPEETVVTRTESDGWVVSQQPANPYSNVTAAGPLTPFLGKDVDAYSGAFAGDLDAYTGGPSGDPFTTAPSTEPGGDSAAAATSANPTRGAAPDYLDGDLGVHEPTDAEIQSLVARYGEQDAGLEAAHADQSTPAVLPTTQNDTTPPSPDSDLPSPTQPGSVGDDAGTGYLPASESQSARDFGVDDSKGGDADDGTHPVGAKSAGDVSKAPSALAGVPEPLRGTLESYANTPDDPYATSPSGSLADIVALSQHPYYENVPAFLVQFIPNSKPGDYFASPDDAAAAAFAEYNSASISINKEFAGLIYMTSDGWFTYTPPSIGWQPPANLPPDTQIVVVDGDEDTLLEFINKDSTGSSPSSSIRYVPNDALIVGDYHTHAAYALPTDNEFSDDPDRPGWGDLAQSRNAAASLDRSQHGAGFYTSYLATPGGLEGIYRPLLPGGGSDLPFYFPLPTPPPPVWPR